MWISLLAALTLATQAPAAAPPPPLSVLVAPPDAAGAPSHVVEFAQEHVAEQLRARGLVVVRIEETDSDGDGILDKDDPCPDQAEDFDGFQDEDGCPDPDNDRDGIPDADDKCPNEPETINGVQDEDGCPDKGKVKVLVDGERIVILEKVYFATGKDVILARSHPLLKQVAAVLRANPQVELVRIEGHTDDQGNDAKNLDLSQRRANNVRAFLMKEGIAEGRMEAVGYGETKPVDTNKTAKGRENNRRVGFTILRVGKVEVEREAR